MKNLSLCLALVLCSSSLYSSTWGQFLKPSLTQDLTPKSVIAEIMTRQKDKNVATTVTIESCCKKKGCWAKAKFNNNQSVKIKFKDYSYFIPEDKRNTVFKARVQGVFKESKNSLENEIHYLMDEGLNRKQALAKLEKNPSLLKKNYYFEANAFQILGNSKQ